MSSTTASPATTTTPRIIAIINSINSSDPQKNLFRAIIAMQTIVNASPGTIAIPSTTAGAPPIQQAYPKSDGVKTSFGAFDITPFDDGVNFLADLPYSSKVFGSTFNIRKSIVPVAEAVMPIIRPVATPVPVTNSPKNMEQYLYDQAVASSKAKFDFIVNPANGLTFIRVMGAFDQPLDSLLIDETVIQGGGG